jgi:thiol-disulfide isomerase/thioredoxin
VDDARHSLDEFRDRQVVVVVFSCNHCPYVKAYEERIIATQRDYANRGVAFVAISANDAGQYPDDSFENMVKRAKEKGYNFPYLYDESQAVARAYGAERTPEFFVLDDQRMVRYHGRLDDNVEEPEKAKAHYLRDALDAVLSGKPVATVETPPVGCTIKWKS